MPSMKHFDCDSIPKSFFFGFNRLLIIIASGILWRQVDQNMTWFGNAY